MKADLFYRNLIQGKWRLPRLVASTCCLALAPWTLCSQTSSTLIDAEYYFDTDPGYGQGIDIPVGAGGDLDIEFVSNIDHLETGIHEIYVRVLESRTENGATTENWSLRHSSTFYVTPGGDAGAGVKELVRAEYYFDEDPGIGNANPFNIPSQAEEIDLTQVLDISELDPGFHLLGIRVQDETGSWSLSASRPLFVSAGNSEDPESIVAAEYFFDTDPGFGQANPIQLSEETSQPELDFVLNLDALSPGLHNLVVRVQDSVGRWSLSQTQTFYLAPGTPDQPTEIIAAEYFFDSDPGFGNATPCPFTPSGDLDENFIISVVGLEDGEHTLYIRALDSDGQWSLTHTQTFTAELPANAPAFVVRQSPTNATIIDGVEGPSVIFSVRADGDGELTYVWRHNGIIIPGVSGAEISFDYQTVKLADAGEYTVTVSNAFGEETGLPFNLEVKAPPEFLSEPTSLTALQGEEAVFATSIYGSDPLAYVWLKDGVPVPEANASSLTFSSAQPGDEGVYQLRVTNDVGSALSAEVTLTVLVPPTITSITGSVEIYETQNFTLTATADGTAPLNAQWKKDGSNVSGATGLEYQVTSALVSDSGSYTLQVTNDAGVVESSPVNVQVQPLPELEISNLVWSDENGFQFEVTDVIDTGSYQIEASSLETEATWTELTSIDIAIEPIPGSPNFKIRFTDRETSSATQRFYRVRRIIPQ